MKHNGIVLKGFKLNKKGELVRDQRRLDVSTRLKMQSSKRVRVKRNKGIGFL